jgi:glycerol-3-phosphate acyltransferase PlsY
MSPALAQGLFVALAFGVGAIPWALFVTKWVAGVDVRTVGSGNVGATNAMRAVGKKWGLLVFALDAAKGAVPALLFARLAGAPDSETLRNACGLAAVLGHVFNPFLGFKGGKGVATSIGAILALNPLAGAVILGVFVVVLAATRYVSLASSVAAASLVPTGLLLGSREFAAFAAVAATIVVVKHRANFARLKAGTEPKAFSRKAPHAG